MHLDVNGVSAPSTLRTTSRQRNESDSFGLQRAGQEPCLAKNLEAVADPEYQPSGGCELGDGMHGRREARDRAAAEVVAVGEAAWQNDACNVGQPFLGVPHRNAGSAELVERVKCVAVVVRAGKRDDGDAWAGCAHWSSIS